jgi:hypothetical protein
LTTIAKPRLPVSLLSDEIIYYVLGVDLIQALEVLVRYILSITYTVPTRGSNIAEEDPSTKQAPRPKVRTPDTFDSKHTELKKFLLQYDLYLELREKDFDNKTDKVYFAIALLRDTAAD